jgi:hypothetical protein
MALDEFTQGVLMAGVILVLTHDEAGMAADVLKELSCADVDCSEMDEFDKKYLRKINKARSFMKLRGLYRPVRNPALTQPQTNRHTG